LAVRYDRDGPEGRVVRFLLWTIAAAFSPRTLLITENLCVRQQPLVLQRRRPQPRLKLPSPVPDTVHRTYRSNSSPACARNRGDLIGPVKQFGVDPVPFSQSIKATSPNGTALVRLDMQHLELPNKIVENN
jgi:hypothetical protein